MGRPVGAGKVLFLDFYFFLNTILETILFKWIECSFGLCSTRNAMATVRETEAS